MMVMVVRFRAFIPLVCLALLCGLILEVLLNRLKVRLRRREIARLQNPARVVGTLSQLCFADYRCC